MTTHIPLTRARINLGAIIKRVHNGKEQFVLEKDGISVAALVNIDDFEDYIETRDPQIRKIIEESHEEYKKGKMRSANNLLREIKGKSNVRASRVYKKSVR
jgi:PHD/YefM family antitoxin component YafN of YafNO toxin-antitoxin module